MVCGLGSGVGVDEVQGVGFRVTNLDFESKGLEVMVKTKSRA